MFLAIAVLVFPQSIERAVFDLEAARSSGSFDAISEWRRVANSLAAGLDHKKLTSLPLAQSLSMIESRLSTRTFAVSLFSSDASIAVKGTDDLRLLDLFAVSVPYDHARATAASVLLERAEGKWKASVLDAVAWGERGIMMGDASIVDGCLVRVGEFVTGGNAVSAGAQVWRKQDGVWKLAQEVSSVGSSRGKNTLETKNGKLLKPISVVSRVWPRDGPNWTYVKQSWKLVNGRLIELPRERVPRPDE